MLFVDRILVKILCVVGSIYLNRQLKEVQSPNGRYVMKGRFQLKGFKAQLVIKEKTLLTNADGSTALMEPVEVVNAGIGIEETDDEVEMSDDEFKHIYTTVKEDLANMREVVLVPLMEKIFTVADNLTVLADKKISAGIECQKLGVESNIKINEAQHLAPSDQSQG